MARPTLMRHRKFIRLVATLGSQPLARGVLEMIWDAAYESGDERIGGPAELEVIAGWSGERGALATALIACGFIDQVSPDDLRIHDLWHHAPDYVQKRRARELQRQERVSPSTKRRTVTAERRTVTGQRPKISSEHSVTPKGAPAPAPAPALAPAQEESVSSVPALAVTEPAVMTFPVVGAQGAEWVLTQRQMAEWVELFPNLDVPGQMRVALAWARANPTKRKTASGMPKFLVSWLTRATDSTRGSPATVTPFTGTRGDKGSRAIEAGQRAMDVFAKVNP